jgi:hypothetical protein
MYLLCFMHQATILCPSFPFLVYPFFSFILHYSSRMVLVLFRMLAFWQVYVPIISQQTAPTDTGWQLYFNYTELRATHASGRR